MPVKVHKEGREKVAGILITMLFQQEVHPRSGIGLSNVRRGNTGIEQLLYPLAGKAADSVTLLLDCRLAMRLKRFLGESAHGFFL